ncbi:YhgE/Pip family protein [Leucobacter sp. GX0328]
MSLFTRSTELKRFRQGVLPKIALAVLLVIPLIYGALYLWAFWAPTENMNRLPVAIVNLDESAEAPDGSELAAGDDVVTELQKGGDLDWKPLSDADAQTAVADGDVYFAVTIPRDFSQTLAGLQDDPKAGQLEVVYNDNNSFLASTLGKTAMVQLRDAVAETTTRTAAEQVMVGVEKLSDGTRDAASAAGTLEDGTKAVADGTTQLSAGLGELADGTAQIVAGSPELVDGTNRLATGLGAASSGSAQLAAGAGELDAKLGEAQAGSTQLRAGMDELAAQAPQLSGGIDAALAGSQQLQAGVGAAQAGAQTLSGGLDAVAALAAANPTMTLAELDAALATQGSSIAGLAAGGQQLSGGIDELSAGSQGLTGGLTELSGKASVLPAKANEAQAGATQLEQGLVALKGGTSTIAGKSGELAAGIATASDGANQLAAGASQLADGASRLNDGAQQASEKSGELAEGASKVSSGSATFADKLTEGAAEAPAFAKGQPEKIAETMAAPIELTEVTENEVQGFGEGFAPFFIALASFVGALITWLILRPMPRRPFASNVSGLRSVLTGFWPAALIGLGQVVVMMLVLVYGIGMQPVHWFGMASFMLLVTLAFLALQQMFIAVLGTATGRVVSLVLLMLMLSSSGGTYPVETTPAFFQALHPFMPASYVVDGLRQLIGGGIDGRFWGSLLVMVGVLIGSLAISAIAARRQKVWTIGRLHPELAI